jgi:probable HAF family extracellular repeat protein
MLAVSLNSRRTMAMPLWSCCILLIFNTFRAQATPPQVRIDRPNDGAVYWTIEDVVVDVIAADADGTVTEVSLQLDGASAGVRTLSPYQFNLGRLSAGTHRLVAHALDNSGEVGASAGHTLFITDPPSSNAPPVVRILSPTNSATILAPATITVQIEATDPDERGHVTRVELLSGLASLGDSTNAPFTITLPKLGAGEYSIIARATDNRFATSDSAPVTFRIVGTNPPRYTASELGTLGGDDAEGWGINNHNHVAGMAAATNNLGARAVWAHSGILQEVAPLEVGWSWAYAINDSTNIIGAKIFDGGGTTVAFLWTPAEGLVDLSASGNALPTAINRHGTIVGYANSQGKPTPLLWENRVVRDFLAPMEGMAMTINDAGQIGGGYRTNASMPHPFVWRNGELTRLPELSTYGGTVNDINNPGLAVGVAYNTNYLQQAVAWRSNQVELLGTFGGWTGSAGAVNDSGTIIGAAMDTNGWERPFLWKDGVMYLVQSLLPETSDLVIRKVSDINSDGVITGVAVRMNSPNGIAVLLRPLAATTNQPPQITLTLTNTIQTELDEPIVIPVQVSDDGLVARVDFYANGELIGVRTNSPFVLTWQPVSSGEVCFRAVATDNQGATNNSATHCVQIEILPTSKPEYVFVDLGLLQQRESFGYAINDGAEIVGYGRDENDNPNGFSFSQGQHRFLNLAPGTLALAINNGGQIAGAAGSRAFILTNTEAQYFDYGNQSLFRRLNNLGWAFGEARNRDGSGEEVMLFDTNGVTFLAHGGTAYGTGLNDLGVAVGAFNGAGFRYSRAAGMQPVPLALPWDINNKGEIVGISGSHPAVVKDGIATMLPTPQGREGIAYGINESGEVAGVFGANSDRRAALWSGGKFYDLNTRLRNATNWILLEAKGINERGDIVGDAMRWLGEYRHAFLLKRLPKAGETNALPTIEWIGPSPTRRYFAGETIPLEVAAWDETDEVVRVDYFMGANKVGTSTNRPFQLELRNPPAGQHVLTAFAVDFFGATNSAVLNLAVTAIDPNAPTVAILAASTDAALEEVRFNVRNSGLFRGVDAIRLRRDDPALTASVLSRYDAVLLFSTELFNSSVNVGNLLANFVDSGKGVVVTPSGVEGRLATGGYLPFYNQRPGMDRSLSLRKELPQHPILRGINSVEAQYAERTEIDIAPDVVHVARWSNGDPLLGLRKIGNGRIAGFNMIAPSELHHSWSWKTNSDGGKLLANALYWAANPRSPLTVAITAPANSFQIHPGGTVTINASVQSTSTVQRVDFYADAERIFSDTNAPFSVQWTPTLVKTNVLTAVAYDAAGNEAISEPIFLRVSSRITVTLTQPPSGATYFVPTDLNFAAQVTDLDGQITKVEFFVGPDRMGIATNAPYAAAWRNAGVGTYEVFARATDSLGSVAESARAIVHILNDANPDPTTWIGPDETWHHPASWSAGVPRILDPAFLSNGRTISIFSPAYARDLNVARDGGSGHVIIDAGSLTVSNEVILSGAAASTSSLTVRPSSRMTSRGLYVGLAGSGTVTQHGGTINVQTLALSDTGASAEFHLTDGEVNAESEFIGSGSDAFFQQAGGTNRAGSIQLGNRRAGTARYHLSGGLLAVGVQRIGGQIGVFSGAGELVLSGGRSTVGELEIGYEGTGRYHALTGRLEVANLILGTREFGTLSIEPNAEVIATRSFILGDGGNLRSEAGGTIQVAGLFDNTAFHDTFAGTTTNIGLVILSNAVPTEFEVASQGSRGFTNNYAWDLLRVSTGAAARLIDRRVNTLHPTEFSETFMAGRLALDTTSTLDLNSLGLHVKSASISGALALNGGSISSGDAIRIGETGSITGAGVVVGSMTNRGAIELSSGAGRLDVSGSVAQGPTGRQIYRIGGREAGVNYQFLNVSGDCRLDGTARVELAGGFAPVQGDRFRLVESRQRIGRFSHVNVPRLANDLALQLSYTPGGAVLDVVKAPLLTVEGPATRNPQTGLFQQSIRLQNPGTNAIHALRLYLGNIPPTTQLVTVSGEENGRRFVQLNSGLAAGATQTVLLEFSGEYGGFTAADLSAEIAHIGESNSSGGEVTELLGERISSGSFLFRFSTLSNRIYRVQYSSDMRDWKNSEPPIIGTGGQVQWIDFGPPRTESRPVESGSRYYRLVLLP